MWNGFVSFMFIFLFLEMFEIFMTNDAQIDSKIILNRFLVSLGFVASLLR